MKEIKITFLVLSTLFLFLFITGCSNYNEINNVLIVDGIGIDKNDDKYIVSFNTFIEEDKYNVINIEVDNLEDAFSNFYLVSNKKIYLSHLNILLLSSNLNNEDISFVINTFNNRDDLRGTFLISMVHDYDKDIFLSKSLYLVNLIKNNYYESGNVYPTTFNEVISNYLDYEISYIPVINNDLSIKGIHSIFSEFRFYNLEESKYLNLLMNKTSSLVLDIDNEEVHFSDIKVCYEVDSNKISINIYSSYYSKLDDLLIKDYVKDKLLYLINLDINNNYFKDLIKKKDYNYYSNNSFNIINYDINIYLSKEIISNIKEDNIFEKDN